MNEIRAALDTTMPTIIVVGVGPGIGTSVARTPSTVAAALDVVAPTGQRVLGVQANAADAAALSASLERLVDALIQFDAIGDLTVAGHLEAWAINVVGAITTAATVLPAMAAVGHGSYVITGEMPAPDPRAVSLSLGKAGVRALTRLLDEQYRPQP